MRALNKIIFINSAGVPYSEVRLDGNVHFTGTQGVGKSTILRSILFFYNADTQKLGIPIEKRTYTDYYFPYSNSYVVYEVIRETGAFCVVSYKAMNRVCFRFIDAAYDKDLFIDKDNLAYSGPDKIRAVLDEKKIKYTRSVTTYDEYRNIIYGNNKAIKDFSRYSLMESRNFQNLYTTIQNVFLNSKLNAEFVKQTIISSLQVEGLEIDLARYKLHLNSFEMELKDIEEFQKRGNSERAELISDLSKKIDRSKKSLKHLCRELYVAHQKELINSKELASAQQNIEKEYNDSNNKLESFKLKFAKKSREIGNEIAIIASRLKDAKKKEDNYSKQGIDQIIERVGKKDFLQTKQQSIKNEIIIFESQYDEISSKYRALSLQLDEKWNAFLLNMLSQRESFNKDLTSKYKQLGGMYNLSLNESNKEFEELTKRLDAESKSAYNLLLHTKLKIDNSEKDRYFEKEQIELSSRIDEDKVLLQNGINEIRELELKIKELKINWLFEEEKLKSEFDKSVNDIDTRVVDSKEQLSNVHSILNNYKDSFASWLTNNYPHWEENFGKVCHEDLLLNKSLEPIFEDNKQNNIFFGININLSEIDRNVKTLADYKKQKDCLEVQIKELNTSKIKLQEDFIIQSKKLSNRFAIIKEHKKNIAQKEYYNSLVLKRIDEERWALQDLEKKEKQKREEVLDSLRIEEKTIDILVTSIQKKITEFEAYKSQKLSKITLDYEKSCKALEKDEENNISLFKQQEQDEKSRIETLRLQYNKANEAELIESGVDINRIAKIKETLVLVTNELEFIKANESKVIEYYKDKREIFDNLSAWRQDRKKLQDKLAYEEDISNREIDSIRSLLTQIKIKLEELKNQISFSFSNLKAFDNISNYEWYDRFKYLFCNLETASTKTTDRCEDIVGGITRTWSSYNQQRTSLRKEISIFVGSFSEGNIFNFPIKFISDEEIYLFAERLCEFVENKKIDEYVSRINTRHSDIFSLIGNDANNLASKEGDIQKIINKTNKGFEECNFVGVIQKIEMRLEESSNRVVKLLRDIKNFKDEFEYDLSAENNLFSSESHIEIKIKAVELLKLFMKEVNLYKKDKIRLSDSFELRFRVIENQNDTGFVERLSNVGSEGTDVLVKAMINIMLLNVFKDGAAGRFKDFKLHCMMDEIGRLHPSNIAGILQFANERNILLINGSPTEMNNRAYKHVYSLAKDSKSQTRIKRILTNTTL